MPDTVEGYAETCAKLGKEPQKAYSGKMIFRVSPELQRRPFHHRRPTGGVTPRLGRARRV
jgi:hypothetical protein